MLYYFGRYVEEKITIILIKIFDHRIRLKNVIIVFFIDSSTLNRTVNWKDSCRLHVPLYNSISLKAGPLDFNIFQKTEKNSSTTEIQVRKIIIN